MLVQPLGQHLFCDLAKMTNKEYVTVAVFCYRRGVPISVVGVELKKSRFW